MAARVGMEGAVEKDRDGEITRKREANRDNDDGCRRTKIDTHVYDRFLFIYLFFVTIQR